MKEQFIVCGYNITTDPRFQNKRFGVTPKLEKQLGSLAIECQSSKNKKMIGQLTQLILQNPTVPMLKNYLSVAYHAQGNHKKAMEVNHWILTEHPDYLFAKINLAHSSIEEGEFEKVTDVLGQEMEIKRLYPERDLFHLSEVTGFYHVAIRYFAAIDDLVLAENRLKILREIAPEHPDTIQAESYLLLLRLKNAEKIWEEEQRQQISPDQVKTVSLTNNNNAPQFNHPEIDSLYRFGLKIPRETLKEIIALPRLSLIEDLERVLLDGFDRYGYFGELDYEEETQSFVLHALFLLREINSEGSLPKILSFLEYDYEFLDFWLGDHKTASLWQCLYGLGLKNTNLLEHFLLKPGIDTFSKSAVSQALCQMVLHCPEKREEISAIYSEVFTRFSKARPEDNLLDSEFLGLAIGDLLDCRLQELLPLIKILYEKQYVALGINGDYMKVEKEFSKEPGFSHKKNIHTIFELYDDALSNWFGYKEERNYPEDKNKYSTSREIPQQAVSEKIGRNDDCPCGSGKKYKKCCMKK
jgi:hypothetical protein